MSNQPYLEQPNLHTKAPWRAALLTQPGNLKARLAEAMKDPNKTLFGTAQGIPSVFITKVMASAKPDFIWLDIEHAMFDRLMLNDAIQAAQHHSEGASQVVVRVPKHDEAILSTSLDAGASGIVIPHTDNVQDVNNKVKEIFYPPIGQRSFSPWTFAPGVSDQSLYEDDSLNMGTANNHIILVAQIESVEGLKNLEEIAAHPHVHALMFGPGDYMADAGHKLRMGDPPHPALIEAMTRLATVAAKYNKPLFGGALAMEQIPTLVQSGYRAIAVYWDVWKIAQQSVSSVAEARAIVAKMTSEQNGAANGNGEAKEPSEEEKTTLPVNGKKE